MHKHKKKTYGAPNTTLQLTVWGHCFIHCEDELYHFATARIMEPTVTNSHTPLAPASLGTTLHWGVSAVYNQVHLLDALRELLVKRGRVPSFKTPSPIVQRGLGYPSTTGG